MLPIRDMDEFDVNGVLFACFPSDANWERTRQNIETRIADDADRRQDRFRQLCLDGRTWTERQQTWWNKAMSEEDETNRALSPWTIHLYFIREQVRQMEHLTPWEIEKRLLETLPGQFHAHYIVNQNDPHAKPWENDDNLEENPKGYLVCTGKKIDWDDAESQHLKAMAKLEREIGETPGHPTKQSSTSEPVASTETKPEIQPVFFIDLALKGF